MSFEIWIVGDPQRMPESRGLEITEGLSRVLVEGIMDRLQLQQEFVFDEQVADKFSKHGTVFVAHR